MPNLCDVVVVVVFLFICCFVCLVLTYNVKLSTSVNLDNPKHASTL